MTDQIKQKIHKYNIPLWLSGINFVFLMTLAFNTGTIKAQFENGIERNAQTLREHIEDDNVHMPFSKKIEIFVPRNELNSKLEDIFKQLEKIEKKLD